MGRTLIFWRTGRACPRGWARESAFAVRRLRIIRRASSATSAGSAPSYTQPAVALAREREAQDAALNARRAQLAAADVRRTRLQPENLACAWASRNVRKFTNSSAIQAWWDAPISREAAARSRRASASMNGTDIETSSRSDDRIGSNTRSRPWATTDVSSLKRVAGQVEDRIARSMALEYRQPQGPNHPEEPVWVVVCDPADYFWTGRRSIRSVSCLIGRRILLKPAGCARRRMMPAHRKGKPGASRGRKATGLGVSIQSAGLPKPRIDRACRVGSGCRPPWLTRW